ncbi:hypothetical protein M3I53_05585 [Paraburkholderia sp. CNPSo 3272]|uniref:hypothetical protein n=1 Tax=Paraburkholderia sp. CNPSo 3272 TaxID=2940931 RepID=UPI0020B8F8CE|nr:hypothetical protein [Paraburkholderia sp. CNPSo 3272]MCP3722609.1 hypothetical protein [Paraburkholderia sp. CNPSo 3272]
MTTPFERASAILDARDFLQQLSRMSAPNCPQRSDTVPKHYFGITLTRVISNLSASPYLTLSNASPQKDEMAPPLQQPC